MKTAIVTDSAAYLDPQVAADHNITVVPITVIFGQQTYLENIDITSEAFYDKMRTTEKLPTTSQITMGQMQQVFDQLIKAGYDEVICIHLSSGITSFVNNLTAYAQSVEGIEVYPFDSKITSAGEGFLALEAARLVAQGEHAATIMPKLVALRATMGVYFVVDDLSHLLRTGRISNSAAFVGNLLRIKPILSFNDAGQIVALTKERTKKRAFQKVLADFKVAVESVDYPVRVSVIDGNNPEESAQWVATLTETFPGMPIETSHIGPVVGVHTGEKVMGLIWSRDYLA